MNKEVKHLRYRLLKMSMSMIVLSMINIGFSVYIAIDFGMNYYYGVIFIAIMIICAIYRYFKLFNESKKYVVKPNEKTSRKNR